MENIKPPIQIAQIEIPEIPKQIIKNEKVIIISSLVLIFIGLMLFIMNPEVAEELINGIKVLGVMILICYFCARVCGGRKQSQSQQVIIGSAESTSTAVIIRRGTFLALILLSSVLILFNFIFGDNFLKSMYFSKVFSNGVLSYI